MTRPPAKLAREWRARLAAEGFEDIEYTEDGPLKVACRENRGIDPLDYESTTEYFSRAAEYLDRHEWETPVKREAWRMHVEGASLREIARAHGRSLKWAFGLIGTARDEMSVWWSATSGEREQESVLPPELVGHGIEVRRYRQRRRREDVSVGIQLEFEWLETPVPSQPSRQP